MQDYGALLRTHRENNADITIATHAVGKKQAYLRGITKVEPDTGLLPGAVMQHNAPLVQSQPLDTETGQDTWTVQLIDFWSR